jgi:DNA-binding NarL/FixJ family response regulator
MRNKKKLLIIDDELDFVDAFRKIFEVKNFRVFTASSVTEGQQQVEINPDVIVLGTIAPAGQAFSMYSWLREHSSYKDIPILVIDARYDERADRGWRRFEGIQLESEGYVSKPIEPASLVPRVLSILEEMAGPRKIKILIVDDHTMVRHGIRALLTMQKDMEVVGEAVNGKEALEQVKRLVPSVTLMDIVMPVMSGLEATRKISAEYPETKVLVLTQYDEEENMLVAKQAGAHGFIPKRAASSELLNGIRAVSVGKYFPWSLS